MAVAVPMRLRKAAATGFGSGGGGRSRVLVTVTVLGSAGPLRFLVDEGETVAGLVRAALRCYAREGRMPLLGADPADFLLYTANGGSDALKADERISFNGCRSFLLWQKAAREEPGSATTSPARKASGGGWKGLNKFLSFSFKVPNGILRSARRSSQLNRVLSVTQSVDASRVRLRSMWCRVVTGEPVAPRTRTAGRIQIATSFGLVQELNVTGCCDLRSRAHVHVLFCLRKANSSLRPFSTRSPRPHETGGRSFSTVALGLQRPW